MLHAIPLLPLLILASVPADYQAGMDEAKTRGVPLYVLVTGDNCPACHKVLAAGIPRALARRGVVRIVNVSKLPVLAAHLLGKSRSIPQLIRFRWVRKRWRSRAYLGVEEITSAVNEPVQSDVGQQATGLMSVKVPAIRQVNTHSQMLNDLLARNQKPTGETEAGSQAHYATHFINSQTRNEWKYDSAVYLGGGKAYLLNEPATTLRQVQASTPRSLQGSGFWSYVIAPQSTANVPAQYHHLPLVDQNASPLFLLDEWSAYLAGTQALAETRTAIDVDDIRVLEMMVYSFVACQCAEQGDKTWLPATKHLVRIMVERTSKVCEAAYNVDPAGYRARCGEYITRLRNAPDAEPLRAYIREVWGTEWTRNLLGF